MPGMAEEVVFLDLTNASGARLRFQGGFSAFPGNLAECVGGLFLHRPGDVRIGVRGQRNR